MKEVDPEATGFIEILSFSKLNFGVKEEKPKEVPKKDAPAKKKKSEKAQLIQIFKIKSKEPVMACENRQSIKHWNVFLHQG